MFGRLFKKIPAHLPKAFVVGILCWCVAAVLFLPAYVFTRLGWHAATMAVVVALAVCIIAFQCCVAWFVGERASGRVAPWRW